MPTLVFKNRHANLRASLGASAARLPDAPHLVFPDRGIELTFSDVVASVARIAAVLAEHGVGKGDVVAFAAANVPAYTVAWWATVCSGAVVVEPQRLVDARTSSPTASSSPSRRCSSPTPVASSA